MDLREQLALTLGDAYSIERELGGGGMSRVFVATEKALGRRVVVKVLPEEMANAWGTMADDFVAPRQALPHIRPAVQRALDLDPASAEAHAQLGVLRFFYDWDLVSGIREFSAALALDSANATASQWLPIALDLDPALADSATRIRERGVRLNPGSAAIMSSAVSVNALRALTDGERRKRCTASSRMGASLAVGCAANRLLLVGDTAGARALVRADLEARGDQLAKLNGSATAHRARWFATLQDTANALRMVQLAIGKSAHEYVREDVIAGTYFLLGDVDRSVDWWRRAVESNGAQVIYLARDPAYERLRRDPRIQALLVKAGVR